MLSGSGGEKFERTIPFRVKALLAEGQKRWRGAEADGAKRRKALS